MRNRNMTLPTPVLQKVAQLGTAGRTWLADLDGLIEQLEQEWQITVGAALPGGTQAYVAQAIWQWGSFSLCPPDSFSSR